MNVGIRMSICLLRFFPVSICPNLSWFRLHFLKYVSIPKHSKDETHQTASRHRPWNSKSYRPHAVRFNGCIGLFTPRPVCIHSIFALKRTCLPPRTVWPTIKIIQLWIKFFESSYWIIFNDRIKIFHPDTGSWHLRWRCLDSFHMCYWPRIRLHKKSR